MLNKLCLDKVKENVKVPRKSNASNINAQKMVL